MSELKTVGKMSQLMFWNKNNSNNNNNSSGNCNQHTNSKELDSKDSKSGATKDDTKHGNKRSWLHTPDALINGHIVYLVKFFGNLPVDQPKGIEVVKDTIRKLQFAQQMKKAETGTQEKFKKVEITISVDGVAVQEPRTQQILHQFPLHNISYCADEKGVKKFFSFIAKTIKSGETAVSNGYSGSGAVTNTTMPQESHECFVFISNKLASDITLTIGQAFELAFRKYINSTEKTELGKAQQQISDLEKTVNIYKNRLLELSQKLSKSDLDILLFKFGVKDVLEVPDMNINNQNGSDQLTNGAGSGGISEHNNKLLIDTTSMHMLKSSSAASTSFLPTVPPRSNLATQIIPKSGSQKMEELLLNSDSDSDFDPRAEESNMDGHSTNSSSGGNGGGGGGVVSGSGSGGGFKTMGNDLFGFEPPKSFGQQLFHNNNDTKLRNNNNNNSFSEITITPPLLAPPPKAAVPRRSTSAQSTNVTTNSLTNGNSSDLFGSDPFEMNGTSTATSALFHKEFSKISVDDFTLESLDPLRK